MRSRDRQTAQRGAVAVLAALLLAALLGFFALALNVGIMMDTRGQLQNASDAAALAAVRSLNGQTSGLDAARAAASAYSLQHKAYGDPVTIDAYGADLIFGRWHLRSDECRFGGGADCFESLLTTEPRKITAVKIRNGRDGGTHNAPIPLPFGALVGASTATVPSAAVAVGAGSGAVSCALPLAVAECKIVNLSNQMNCTPGTPQRMTFSNANNDSVGFINMYYPDDNNAPSETWSADVITNRLCNPSQYKVGPAKLQNGNDFAKVADALRGLSGNGKGQGGGACLIGTTQTLAVSDAGCPGNPIFQGVQNVVGFVKATIVAVTDNQGKALGCPGGPAPSVGSGLDKNSVIVDIPCTSTAGSDEWGGGRSYNGGGVRVRLVQ